MTILMIHTVLSLFMGLYGYPVLFTQHVIDNHYGTLQQWSRKHPQAFAVATFQKHLLVDIHTWADAYWGFYIDTATPKMVFTKHTELFSLICM